LIELILVMLIVAIMAAVAAPSLRWFLIGRRTVDTGTRILALSDLARTRAISEARTYYLNFDPIGARVYLTVDAPGDKGKAPLGTSGTSLSIPTSIRMRLQSGDAPQPVVLLPWPADFQPQMHAQPSQLLDGTAAGAGTIWVFPSHSGYVEFQPTGRTDPATVQLTDNSGRTVQVVCEMSTDRFHIQEAVR
jgi:type II secretory pathway pseudopilin PulG